MRLGVRAFCTYRHPSPAPCCFWNWARLHLHDPQASTLGHQARRQESHPGTFLYFWRLDYAQLTSVVYRLVWTHRSRRQALRTVLMENPQRIRRRKSVTHKFLHHKLPCLGGIRECTPTTLHPSNSSKLPTSNTCSSSSNNNRALEANTPCHRRLECPTSNNLPGRKGWMLIRGRAAGTDNDA